MKQQSYHVEYILVKEEKGKRKEYSLGGREISVSPNGISKEALAFRRASRKQLDANKLILTRIER